VLRSSKISGPVKFWRDLIAFLQRADYLPKFFEFPHKLNNSVIRP